MSQSLNPVSLGGRVRTLTYTLTYASQAADSYSTSLKLPVGAVVVGGIISTSVTTGSATVALGITGSTTKYKAAAAVTSTTQVAIAIPHAAVNAATTAEEEILITTAAAALPASGTLTFVLFYVKD